MHGIDAALKIVVLTGFASIATAVEAIKLGAFGLMQIMPAAATDYMRERGLTVDKAALARPATNMDIGQRHLERRIARHRHRRTRAPPHRRGGERQGRRRQVDDRRQPGERLSNVRGPGLGFTTTAAAVYAAIRATPGTELTGLDFQPNGDLRLSVAAARESLPTDLKRALERAGFTVNAGVFQSANGRVTGEMTVTRR